MTSGSNMTLMRAVGRVHREWRGHMRRCALEVGIPDSYRSVIMYLSRNPGANQRMLAEFSDKSTAAINQIVKKMTDSGYIEKQTSESDGRNTMLYLTDKGKEKAELLRAKLALSDKAITAMIGAEREEELISLLSGISVFIGEL